MSQTHIELEGVRVHNLKNFDLQISRNLLTVICGVSGSGKSSLAFDTLFAEGQRRYIETFSPYARQFLDRIERPDVDRIEGIPPAIALRQNAGRYGPRSTVGTRTEITDHLRVLFARFGQLFCPDCNMPVNPKSPQAAARYLLNGWPDVRVMFGFRVVRDTDRLKNLLQRGVTRAVDQNRTVSLESVLADEVVGSDPSEAEILLIIDRLKTEAESEGRLSESIAQCYELGHNNCIALLEIIDGQADVDATTVVIDHRRWKTVSLTAGLVCAGCGREFQPLTPESLSHRSPLGACPKCEGHGSVSDMTLETVVPDTSKTLEEGAIQPWTTPAYRHELDELLALAPDYRIPTNVPFRDLNDHQRRLISEGVPERNFGGIAGFHRWLVRNRYKKGVAVLLSRWRSWTSCSLCRGHRLSQLAASVQLSGKTLPDVLDLEISEAQAWLSEAVALLDTAAQAAVATSIRHAADRLQFLQDIGLDYLNLGRSMRTLSGGEAQRVLLTAAIGSGLINTLYVLDEPTSGLHSRDTEKVVRATRRLVDAGNTLVVVEHDPLFLSAADQLIEIGPAAGQSGGSVVFQGRFKDLAANGQTSTAVQLRKQSGASETTSCRTVSRPLSERWLEFEGITCHNIRNLSVRVPLNVICGVIGVSGSGKSSLVVDAIYPAICRELGQAIPIATAHMDSIRGCRHISEICLLDQKPGSSNRRSIPATMIGSFDEIRKVMAQTHEARKRNYNAGMFSFNSAKGGRCESCQGHGVITVDMQFLADIETTCEACSGRRFRPDVLEVRYRDRSIHDILEMTADDAFAFFQGHRRIQQRINALRMAGLGYLRLGQPVSTLSGGENQRLNIAVLLSGASLPLSEEQAVIRPRRAEAEATSQRLFILDEPSVGLHMEDIDRLAQCLNHLVDIGHSILLIDHDPQLIARCDYLIELGPGPGQHGGRIIAEGPPGQMPSQE
ncbi:MAG: excinuclease ABC subunit UvrA [Planctomycetaceae bacterium]|nr:excinuclease ABC subunit UvrA [Planctomycetaceae bacterium]